MRCMKLLGVLLVAVSVTAIRTYDYTALSEGHLIQSSLSEDEPHLIQFDYVVMEIGVNIGQHVSNRIKEHLSKVVQTTVVTGVGEINEIPAGKHVLILSLGNAPMALDSIKTDVLNSLPPESFKVQFAQKAPNLFILSANGRPLDDAVHKNISFNRFDVHYGAVLSAYAALELIGFAFLHPLEPFVPPKLRVESFRCPVQHQPDCKVSFEDTESPYWPERSFHIHTQHPLEVTEVLQGHDIPHFGPVGPQCKKFNKLHNKDHDARFHGHLEYCERWEDMVLDVDLMFEWAVANRLNKVEWLLLGNYKWGDELAIRKERFQILTDLGHKYSLLIGADCPIGNIQQHAWQMVNVGLPFAKQVAQIEARVDWIFNAGFDFLTTESGMSEFTNPGCGLMVNLMNAFSVYVNQTWGREAAIKVHCSRGQKCPDHPDPRTGNPINFNFLPTFAHSSMGIFPHSVQMYGLDDPSGGTYGNHNFSYIEDYMVYEAKKGERSVVYYGETAYWVNYDIDIPLFLPLYAQRRQHDLRRLAVREIRENFRIQGQMNFDSGWEWGYWLNDVVTARASWDPLLPSREVIEGTSNATCTTTEGPESCYEAVSVYEAKQDQWEAFTTAIQPVVKIFGPRYAGRVSEMLVRLVKAQEEMLILGQVQGRPCPNLLKLSGIAYMSGMDTWIDLPRLLGLHFTQPDKVTLRENDDPHWPHVLAILQEMTNVFGDISASMKELVREMREEYTVVVDGTNVKLSNNAGNAFGFNDGAWKILHELEDCIHLLFLRAEQLHLLYLSKDKVVSAQQGASKSFQEQARGVLKEASELVLRREDNYRVAVERIAAWRDNPTVYRFTYLWSVHNLYYWWRDQGLAEEGSLQSRYSPCYLNRHDSTEVAVGWGRTWLERIRKIVNLINDYTFGFSIHPLEIVNCLAPPTEGYEFPKDLFHMD